MFVLALIPGNFLLAACLTNILLLALIHLSGCDKVLNDSLNGPFAWFCVMYNFNAYVQNSMTK